MITSINTERLRIEKLHLRDNRFILELLNTEGWKKYIGNRKVNSIQDATDYIHKINENKLVNYWTVKLKYTTKSIGVITLIKRNYREHRDIGFAFLPEYNGNGFAYEATKAVLIQLLLKSNYKYIFAETIQENSSSIKLIKKLGLMLENEIFIDNTLFKVFSATKKEIIAHFKDN